MTDNTGKKVPVFREWYGVRDKDGNINGKIQTRHLFSDVLKGVLVALLLAVIFGGKDAFFWFKKNEDLPEKFAKHCETQIETEKKLAESLGEIKEGIKDLQRSRRRDDR
jgi:hypothetical protein